MPRTDSTQAMQTIIGAYADEDASSDEEKTAATTEATKASDSLESVLFLFAFLFKY